MKTTHKIAALSLMLLFSVVTGFASNTGVPTKVIPNTVIVHQVNLPYMPDLAFCGNYIVEVRNQAGQLIAPPKNLVPGQSQYLFFEKSDRPGTEGTRTAMLHQVTGNGSNQCGWVLRTDPTTLKTNFMPGTVYKYELFPKVIKVVKD